MRRRTDKPVKDPRVTAPMISWQVILTILGIVFFLILVQSFILKAYLNQIPILAGILTNFFVGVCVLLGLLVWLVWRHYIGKPIRTLAKAAQKVASGDFSVHVEPRPAVLRSEARIARVGKPSRLVKRNEIDVLVEDFNRMTRELAGNEILKSDFIANVSHEIKTPLSIIQSYAKALKDGDVAPEDEQEYLDTIYMATVKLNAMITNILKLSKLENQQIFPEPATFQLGEQLRRCALNYMEQWEKKGIQFTIDVADVAIHCDASLLELVWDNLLSNAIKFTPEGGRISVTSAVRGDSVEVRVADTGCGMDEATQSRLFERFYQGDTSHASEGNGLGLALVKKVLDIVGGEISVVSSPGGGTTFTVRLHLISD